MAFIKSVLYNPHPLKVALLVFSLWWLLNLTMRYAGVGQSPAMDHIMKRNSFGVIVPIWTFITAIQAMGLNRDTRNSLNIANLFSALAWAWSAIMLMNSPFAIIWQMCWILCVLSLWTLWRSMKLREIVQYDLHHLT